MNLKRWILVGILILVMVGTVSAATISINASNGYGVSRQMSGTYLQLRDGVGTTIANSSAGNNNWWGLVQSTSTNPNFYEQFRGIMVYDLSTIPANATITNVSLMNYFATGEYNALGTGNAAIIDCYPTDKSSIAITDYNKTTFTRQSVDIPFASISANSWNTVYLTNYSMLTPGSLATLMLTTDVDVDNGTYTWASSQYSGFQFRSQTYSSGAYRPNMTITYTLPDTTPPASITGLTASATNCSQIYFNYTIPVDADFDHLYVLKDGVFYQNITTPTYDTTWSGLTFNQSYTFSAKTVDSNANMNSTWTNITYTANTTCPPISSFNLTSGSTVSSIPITGSISVNTPLTLYADETFSSVYNESGKTYMFNSWGTGIYVRNSTDGVTWGSIVNLLAKGGAGSWDSQELYCPIVWKEGSTYYMTYAGLNGDGFARVGIATASDIMGPWTKYSGNPVYENTLWGGGGSEPWGLMKEGGVYYLWVNNYVGSSFRQLGLITSTDLYNWTSNTNNPLFAEVSNGESWFCPWEFKYNGSYYLIITHQYIDSNDYSNLELYRSSNITFPANNRQFIGTLLRTPSDSSISYSGDLDTPAIDTSNINMSLSAGNITVYYSVQTYGASHHFYMGYFTFNTTNLERSRTTIVSPATITVNDTSTNIPTSWNWSWGDGAFSITQNATHSYSASGNYTITLTTTNLGNHGKTASDSISYDILYTTTPVASFTKSRSIVRIPQTVTFTDTSTNTPTSWAWYSRTGLGSDTVFATTQNPEYSFTTQGVYYISLLATNAAGADWYNDSSPLTVGQGTLSYAQNATHQYTKPGVYKVTLTACNFAGCANTTDRIVVKGRNMRVTPFDVVTYQCEDLSYSVSRELSEYERAQTDEKYIELCEV